MSDSSSTSFFERIRNIFRKKRETDKAKGLAKKQVLSVSETRSFPSWKQWKRLPRVLSTAETRLLQGALAVIVLSVFTIGGWYIATHRVETPAIGGEYTEALVGEPQLINPLYASASDVDADLAELIYAGLMRWDPQNGLTQDLASGVEISEDNTTYTITIREDARFHNGEPVLAKDVIFTFNAIQNPLYRSNLAGGFQDVSVEQVDDRTVAFRLTEPFAPFLSSLTVGILPADVWSDIPPKNATLAALNLEPVGSGPYRFSEFAKDKRGVIQTYTLERHQDYHGNGPLIERLHFKFYSDAGAAVRALDNRNVEGVSFVPTDLEESVVNNRTVNMYRPALPRAISLFFNQEKNTALEKNEVRQAFAHTIDKQLLIDQVLGGHGHVIHGPILPDALGGLNESQTEQDPGRANTLLEEAGYNLEEGATFRQLPADERVEPETETGSPEDDEETTDDADTSDDSTGEEADVMEEYPLTFTLTTVQNPEFVESAELIAQHMRAVGVKIEIDVVDSDTFFNHTLPNDDYELLLTGTLTGIDPDPFPFWHSSQTGENGLNLANYENRNIDELLEQARATTDEQERADLYREFQTTLLEDTPAIFLYQSTYTYALAGKIQNVQLERIARPSDRFANINEWYIRTRKTLK